jgi:hypothetical protein
VTGPHTQRPIAKKPSCDSFVSARSKVFENVGDAEISQAQALSSVTRARTSLADSIPMPIKNVETKECDIPQSRTGFEAREDEQDSDGDFVVIEKTVQTMTEHNGTRRKWWQGYRR